MNEERMICKICQNDITDDAYLSFSINNSKKEYLCSRWECHKEHLGLTTDITREEWTKSITSKEPVREFVVEVEEK